MKNLEQLGWGNYKEHIEDTTSPNEIGVLIGEK